ncbi:MAG: RcnB family protein [Pseudomonadota bacterium]
MHSKKALSTIMAAVLLTSQVAWAQGDSPGANRNSSDPAQRSYERDRRDYDGRQWNRQDRDNRHDRRDFGRSHRGERGAGPDRMYYRGGRLPPEYRSRHYVIEDWRRHHLSAPPRGHQWVQSGGDYLLVAITTGVILSVLLSN